ncbi:MAM and LDL-receptor class A domain-containing protein 2-like [Culex pipiens pallens]|uniref:MAM and LDL-receptor class A domain-containing protein 2-like n=1 Tax=Culex pipiens pallens TaxID=42434 RepID=UPI001954FD8F|nr:MAM and LDL-receptor class A domain-containing protein 2-like [Culex pipiens pallens]
MLPTSLSALPILTVALLLLLEESSGAGGSQYQLTQIRRPKPPILKSGPECPTPYFPNGVAKARQRNKMIRYTCSSGFYLVGNMYSMCEKGRWDAPVPICIKAGCADLETVENGQLSYEYGRAAVMLFCSTGYQIAGSSKAYCNGTHWDRPLGSCRETGLAVQTSCDFEVMDYCGWTNEATHDFDWKRSDGVVSPKALKTGPKYDHTTMVPLAGHFLMVDSAVQLTNETARLLSPLYPANYSQSACFQFFYHMYGDQIGSLTVYVKPSSVSLDSLTAEDVLFHRDTNQGNMWNEGFSKLNEQSDSFQIVIEASLGMKYKSDIAIDDVSLLSGSDCRTGEGQDDVLEISSAVPDEELPAELPTADKDTFKIDSCENRCGANVSSPVRVGELFFIHCDCIEGCVETKTCCPDYAERCVWSAGDSPSSTTLSTTPSTTSTTLTTPSTTPSTTSTTTTTAAPTTTTVRATTSTTQRSTSTTTQSTSTTQRSTTTTQRSTTTTQRSTTTTQRITTTPTTPRTTSTTQRKTTTTRPTTPKPSSTTTTGRPYNLRPRTSTGAPVIVPMVRTRKPTTPTTTTTTSTESTTVELRIISRMNLETLASRSGDTKPNLAHVFIYSGVAAIVFSAIVVAIVLHIRRNSGASVLERLKQKSMKKGTEGFEDVRFLAVDEHLDFSLTPDDAEEAEESDREEAEEKTVQKSGHKPGKKGKK